MRNWRWQSLPTAPRPSRLVPVRAAVLCFCCSLRLRCEPRLVFIPERSSICSAATILERSCIVKNNLAIRLVNSAFNRFDSRISFSRILFLKHGEKEESKESQRRRSGTPGWAKRREGANCSTDSGGETRTCAESGSGEMGKREGAQTKPLGIPNIILVPGLDFLSHTHLQTYRVKDA